MGIRQIGENAMITIRLDFPRDYDARISRGRQRRPRSMKRTVDTGQPCGELAYLVAAG